MHTTNCDGSTAVGLVILGSHVVTTYSEMKHKRESDKKNHIPSAMQISSWSKIVYNANSYLSGRKRVYEREKERLHWDLKNNHCECTMST